MNFHTYVLNNRQNSEQSFSEDRRPVLNVKTMANSFSWRENSENCVAFVLLSFPTGIWRHSKATRSIHYICMDTYLCKCTPPHTHPPVLYTAMAIDSSNFWNSWPSVAHTYLKWNTFKDNIFLRNFEKSAFQQFATSLLHTFFVVPQQLLIGLSSWKLYP